MVKQAPRFHGLRRLRTDSGRLVDRVSKYRLGLGLAMGGLSSIATPAEARRAMVHVLGRLVGRERGRGQLWRRVCLRPRLRVR